MENVEQEVKEVVTDEQNKLQEALHRVMVAQDRRSTSTGKRQGQAAVAA